MGAPSVERRRTNRSGIKEKGGGSKPSNTEYLLRDRQESRPKGNRMKWYRRSENVDGVSEKTKKKKKGDTGGEHQRCVREKNLKRDRGIIREGKRSCLVGPNGNPGRADSSTSYCGIRKTICIAIDGLAKKEGSQSRRTRGNRLC